MKVVNLEKIKTNTFQKNVKNKPSKKTGGLFCKSLEQFHIIAFR